MGRTAESRNLRPQPENDPMCVDEVFLKFRMAMHREEARSMSSDTPEGTLAFSLVPGSLVVGMPVGPGGSTIR